MKKTAGSDLPRVIIITNEQDASVDWVVRLFRDRGTPYLRINTERLTDFRLSANPESASWRVERFNKRYDLSQVSGIWYRRPEPPTGAAIDPLTPSQRCFLADQWRACMLGLQSIGERAWINLPHRNMAAENKILQLQVANSLGFTVPSTLVTNERRTALEFAARHPGGVIAKALHAPLIDDPVAPSFVYAQVVDADFLQTMEEHESIPFILQEQIRPKVDLRVTMVDGIALVAETDSGDQVDWRTCNPPARFRRSSIPQELAKKCARFLEYFGLRFGAFDFARRENGQHVFLELNPNGEWGWLQKTCSLPISELIADALERGSSYQ